MHVHHVDRHSDFAAAKMAKNNLFESERMFCDVYCLEPGQAQRVHAHAASDKVYYVIEGDADVRGGRRAADGRPRKRRLGAGRLRPRRVGIGRRRE